MWLCLPDNSKYIHDNQVSWSCIYVTGTRGVAGHIMFVWDQTDEVTTHLCQSIPRSLLTRVTAEGRLSCEDCGRTYKYKAGYYNHRRYECGKSPTFSCNLCHYKAKTRGALKAHWALKHGAQHDDDHVFD
ncbi:hypothetical protein J6590_014725 [Homalodisca vitripennis]|nr:hypothetical protein J6590_014725 [Homalodisca vitripennis]